LSNKPRPVAGFFVCGGGGRFVLIMRKVAVLLIASISIAKND